ncbi:MAG: hypothetical protein P8J37_20410 [Fuerstiella sp.]|nr:hypothetical protein [Fuerstiella sp.]
MSSVKTETFTPLQPEDIVPGDLPTTIWRWCLRNDWVFHPDFNGNEPKIDTRCAWAIVSPDITFKTAKDGILKGIKRHPGNAVLLSDVTRLKQDLGEPGTSN